MKTWKDILSKSITTYPGLQKHFKCRDTDLTDVLQRYPMRINPYYLGLIKKVGDPLWKQAVPDPMELTDTVCLEDPLAEEDLSPVPNLVHKYPDRALFLVSNRCAMYCRFCTRKRKVGKEQMRITPQTLAEGYRYLRNTPQIRDVLLSGGDPLLLDDDVLEEILTNLRQIDSIETIRIGTRVPCTLPMRVDKALVDMLKKFHPLYINTHFNHPQEITPEARKACGLLADGGIPLGCQTVLLKGINDDSATLSTLFTTLLQMRVKPYYLFQADLTRGTNHFRTTTSHGIRIMREMLGHISGMALPTYALDAPDGKGKIPLSHDYILKRGKELHFENYRGVSCSYPEAKDIL